MMNEVHLLGRVGQQPEVRNLEGGAKVANLSLATTEKWKDDKGEKQERTEWHNLEAWNGLANTIESYVSKGDLLHVKGKLQTDSYEKEGQKHYRTKVRITTLNLLPQGKGGLSEKDQKEMELAREMVEFVNQLPPPEKSTFKENFVHFRKQQADKKLADDTLSFLDGKPGKVAAKEAVTANGQTDDEKPPF